MQCQHTVCANSDRLLYGKSLVLDSDSTNTTVHNCQYAVLCGITHIHKGKKCIHHQDFYSVSISFWGKKKVIMASVSMAKTPLYSQEKSGLVQRTDLYKSA